MLKFVSNHGRPNTTSVNAHCNLLRKSRLKNGQLAIEGGEPEIPQGPPDWPAVDVDISASVSAAMNDGSWGKYDARWTNDLVNSLSSVFECENVLLCSSGTIGVELALRGLLVSPDSEVILAGYDFPGNFRAIEAIGARPVLIDVVEGGWVMSPTELESAITEKTAAVIVSHMHGHVADVARIREICDQRKIGFVEDVCQMPGGANAGSPLCSFGDVSVLSFGGSKLLSAGRGGAVLTNSAESFQRMKIFGNRGNEAFPLSQLQAAALLPQLKTLDQKNKQRRSAVDLLIAETAEIPNLQGLGEFLKNENRTPTFYKLPWLLDDVRSNWTRSDFVKAIQAEGIAIDVGFRGFMRRSPRRCTQIGPLTNSRVAAQQTILLHHPVLLENDDIVKKVAAGIQKVANA